MVVVVVVVLVVLVVGSSSRAESGGSRLVRVLGWPRGFVSRWTNASYSSRVLTSQ